MLVDVLDEMLDEMLVDALDGTIDEALIMALDEMLGDAMVTSSRASFKSRMWLVGVLQVEHPCCMQGEFLRQVF